MSEIEDILGTSISDTSLNEGLELLRIIRMKRKVSMTPRRKAVKREKKTNQSISAAQAAEILKTIGGK